MEPLGYVLDFNERDVHPINQFVDSQELLATISSKSLQGRLSLRNHGVFGPVVAKTFAEDLLEKYRQRTVNISARFVFHPNVVLMHGILYANEEDRVAGLYCGIVMEFVEGSSLYAVIHNKNPNDCARGDVIRWSKQACSALAYCHANDVIHRNVSPEVMLLHSDRQTLKLTGFTCAREVASVMTANMNSVRYLAPEMLSREDDEVVEYDEKVDTFAMALSMWEMNYRNDPFEEHRSNTVRHMRSVTGGARPPIEDQNDSLCQLIVRCWHQDPKQRPNMREILSELERI